VDGETHTTQVTASRLYAVAKALADWAMLRWYEPDCHIEVCADGHGGSQR
jgi:hypothetical protein